MLPEGRVVPLVILPRDRHRKLGQKNIVGLGTNSSQALTPSPGGGTLQKVGEST